MSPPPPPSPPPMSVVSSHRHHGIQRHHSNSFSSSSSSSSSKSCALSKKLMQRSRSSPTASHDQVIDSSFTSNSLSSSSSHVDHHAYSLPLARPNWNWNWTSHADASPFNFIFNPLSAVASVFRSFFPVLQSLLVPTCQWLAVAQNKSPPLTNNTRRSSSRKRLLTGTFFGRKKGRVSFAVQETPRSEPILLLELPTPTCHLVKEMASGMVRILLECERNSTTTADAGAGSMKKALWDEPVWTMYCNGHKLGYATSRARTPSDFHVLTTVQSVSVGAGVMPAATTTLQLPMPAPACPTPKESAANIHGASGEIMYMRAKFDRVIGSRDSEAFYMINLDCTGGRGDSNKFNNGGPELSIFLLRI